MKTRVERVYVSLRSDILAGRLAPGTKLPLAELAGRYGASMGVVREALFKLASEGLVSAEPQVGFRVTAISLEDLRDLTESRCHVEGEVFRQSIVDGSLEWETWVIATHHRLTRIDQMASGDPDRISDEWALAHGEFHAALLAGCTNARLLAIAMSLRDSAELYRRWSVTVDHQHRDISSEHEALRDAALAREADRGQGLLCEHIRHTARLLGAEGTDNADGTSKGGGVDRVVTGVPDGATGSFK